MRPKPVIDLAPIALLQTVVTLLDERDDTESHRLAIRLLVAKGPCFGDSHDVKHLSEAEVARIAEALQIYIRGAVRTAQTNPIDLSGVRVTMHRLGHSAISFMGGPMLGQAGLGLLLLMHEVGFESLRACNASDCPRIIVKTYRREFCSERCQKRTYKRLEREAARVTGAQRAGRKIG